MGRSFLLLVCFGSIDMWGVKAKGDCAIVLIAFVLTGLAVTAHIAYAQEKSHVVIGLNVPLTGSYIDQGKDEERAYSLAIDRLNAKGGVLGKKVVSIVKDTQTNAKIARKNALELIRQHGAAMVTGGSSSVVAVAQSDVGRELRIE